MTPPLLSQFLWALFFAAAIELESGYFKAFFLKLWCGTDPHPFFLIFLMLAFGVTIGILIKTLENKEINPYLCAVAVCVVLIASTWMPTE